MPPLLLDEKTELQYNVDTWCLVSKQPTINKVNSGTDFIKFGKLSLLLGNINRHITVFLTESLRTRSTEGQPALAQFN